MAAPNANLLLCPPRFKFARRKFGHASLKILDVGCGNHSPTITKRWFPEAEYHGADIAKHNLDTADEKNLDRFFSLSMEGGGYDAIPDGEYDFVVLNHVLEHIRDPEPVVKAACAKLKTGGLIWIAFPSLRSLTLPRATSGTLNFHDDATHVRMCEVKEVAGWLLASGVQILKAGPSRDLLRSLIGAAILPFALLRRLTTGKLSAWGLWHVLGFEDRVLGVRI